LVNRTSPATESYLKVLQATAQSFGIRLQVVDVREPGQFDRAFVEMVAARAQSLIVLMNPLTVRYRARIVELAAKHRLPGMYGFREFADAGGLMAYGVNVPHLCRRAAIYVDKIIRGTKPGDLPVEQPTTFDFVINLKTAKALG